MQIVQFTHLYKILFEKSSLFHQKLLLIQIAFSQTVGLLCAAQQLIRPPRLLPPILHRSPYILALKVFFVRFGMSSCQMKLRQASPFPPNFQVGSQLQVYQLFLLLVFQIPTTMISCMAPETMRLFNVSCIFQAPNADFESSKRFCPSCINKIGYFLNVLSQYDGGQQMLHFLELLRIFDTIGEVSTIELIEGQKLGQTVKVLADQEAQICNQKFFPIIQLTSFYRILIQIGVLNGHVKAMAQLFSLLSAMIIPLFQLSPHELPLIYRDWTLSL